jgi:hypothetical protein
VILRPKRLAVALAAGELSERDKFLYLILWAVIGALAEGQRATWNGWSRGRVVFVLVGLAISVVGLFACVQANARGDNRAFLERYLCLSVPIGVVTFAAYYGIYYGLAAFGFAVGWIDPDAKNWNATMMGVISSIGALALFFFWMRTSLMRAAGLRAA